MDFMMMCNKIRGKRNELRLSQEEIAKRLGISTRAYNYKENNKTAFTLKEVLILSQIFNCTLADFF